MIFLSRGSGVSAKRRSVSAVIWSSVMLCCPGIGILPDRAAAGDIAKNPAIGTAARAMLMAMIEQYRNKFGQPIGAPVPGWSARPLPPRTPIEGRFCRVEPLDCTRHAADLFAANSADAEGRSWTYLPHGPYSAFEAYRASLAAAISREKALAHAIIEHDSGCAVGVASYLAIDPENGTIEIGAINYSPRLQRRPAATEAMYLLMRRVFDELGYRRYEWKCDSLNAASGAAAERLGFRYEGLFRQAMVYKGRNRNTAWFSVIDHEWPVLRLAFERWLDPANFDAGGRQRAPLASLRPATGTD
jgi:RimJ/RimL family protein N-acetyltransferase